MSEQAPFDVFIVGGGINGCGIARDLVGRGYSVALAEKGDLASGTSSWSTKLIHGGLRYLEHYEFRLVRESLIEREVLWQLAPHIIRPLRFVLPHHEGLRPAWLLRLGLFLYDSLGGRKHLPGTRTLDLARDEAGRPLADVYRRGFEYSDCWVDDARLVVLNARDAADRGAVVRTRTAVVSAKREDAVWRIGLRREDGGLEEARARMIVNAAGPWVDTVLGKALGRNDARNIRLVQGSHIVVRKLFEHDRAYIFQNSDGRIIFAIPYEDDFTLVGTTDLDYTGTPEDAAISQAETDYLIENANRYFKVPVTRDSIVWTYSGVRPLFDDGSSKAQEATRDYILKTEGGDGAPALLNIFGGKLTTYRKLAEAAAVETGRLIGAKGKPWTASAPLPGGQMPLDGPKRIVDQLVEAYPFVEERLARRLVRLYGLRAREILHGASQAEDLGRVFGADLTEREVRFLMETEWAKSAEDVAWRRTKLGLRMSAGEIAALDDFMGEARRTGAAAAE